MAAIASATPRCAPTSLPERAQNPSGSSSLSIFGTTVSAIARSTSTRFSSMSRSYASTSKVTGPSFTSATSMRAPNTPPRALSASRTRS